MILLIDNYDSFIYNLVHALGVLGAETQVVRNDALDLAAVSARRPRAIVISSGAGTPAQAGQALALVQRLSGALPILGVGLGHQIVGAAFGAELVPALSIRHGQAVAMQHNGQGLYRGLKNPFLAGCYHSRVLARAALPAALVVEASTAEEEIMGIRHASHPTYGVQFHPESILTPSGKRLLRNFLELIEPSRERTPCPTPCKP